MVRSTKRGQYDGLTKPADYNLPSWPLSSRLTDGCCTILTVVVDVFLVILVGRKQPVERHAGLLPGWSFAKHFHSRSIGSDIDDPAKFETVDGVRDPDFLAVVHLAFCSRRPTADSVHALPTGDTHQCLLPFIGDGCDTFT